MTRPEVNLESPLPSALPAGSAIALYCSGTAHLGGRSVRELELEADGSSQRLDAVAMPRFDMAFRRSGFWGVIDVRVPREGTSVQLHAGVGDGERVALDEIAIAPQVSRATPPRAGLIAVCMGTFDPDPQLLRAQLDSLRAQTDMNWVCVISDDHSRPDRYAELTRLTEGDERFVLSRCGERIGFYRNFERSLTLAPAEAELFALCDQDDVWHPDKLASLRASLGTASLVYCDQRLVTPDGRVLRNTLWRGRRNNWTDMTSMLIANTITGAASLFTREVVDLALPFPDSPGIEFHDHWIGLAALAAGRIEYLDRPLYDYVQHPGAVLGKVSDERLVRGRLLRAPQMRAWRAAYFLGWVPGAVRARTLLLRAGDVMTPAKRRALERYVDSGASVGGLAWLALRPLRALAGRNETLAAEWELARGVLWRLLAGLVARVPGWPEAWLLDTRFPDPPQFELRRLRRWRGRV